MARTLCHRGPDDGGVWADAEVGIALGHRRLSIIDLSPEGRQPMHSACGRYTVSFNGEIYNFRALRRELERLGHAFRGHSDTEVMLAAISQWGLEAAVRRFNGMFAFALWDRRKRLLHLVRDRLGEKPLYYGWMDKGFVFASELKALCAHPNFKNEINRDSLAIYLRHSCVPAPYSIYRDVYKLLPGTVLTLSRADTKSSATPVPYWSAKEAAERGADHPFAGSAEQAAAYLDALLRDAVKLRMEADVPLGAFLSGGVDSSTVAALMQAQSEQPIKTFTIGFYDVAYDEAKDAKMVAQHLGTEHTEMYVTPQEAMSVIPELPTLYDEPFSDSSQIPTFLVSKLARQGVTVSLSGDGGDELFAGYSRHVWGPSIWKWMVWLPEGLRGVAAKILTQRSPRVWDRFFRQVSPMLPDSMKQRTPGEKLHKLAEILTVTHQQEMYLRLASHWNEPASLVLDGREPPTAATDRGQWAAVRDFSTQMMYLDTITYLPDDILTKVDRASMGVSLEARVPLLDHRAVEFALQVPLAMKLRNRKSKWLLRQVLYKYVPEELIERPKMGFEMPVGAWLRGPLREWAETLLDEQRLRDEAFFAPAPIRQKWAEHLSGKRNWQGHLWDVLMFQAWVEQQSRKEKSELGMYRTQRT